MTTKKNLHTVVIKPGRTYIVHYMPKPLRKPSDTSWLNEAKYLGFDESRDSLVFEITATDPETQQTKQQRRYIPQLGLIELYLSIRFRSAMDRGELIERHRARRAESHPETLEPDQQDNRRAAVLQRLAERREAMR